MRKRKRKPPPLPKPIKPPKLTKSDIDFFTAGELHNDFMRLEEILASDIFHVSNAHHHLVKSAFIEVMVCLRDLLSKVDKYGTRISFTDDVSVTSEIKNITDLVIFIRDAVSHSYTYHHWVVPDVVKSSFIVMYGKKTFYPCPFAPYENVAISSDYKDDVCFCFGLQKIYLKRHIRRAVDLAKDQLLPLPEFPMDVLSYGRPD